MMSVRLALARLGAWGIRGLLRLSGRRAGVVLVYHALAEAKGDPERELVAAHALGQVDAQLRHLRSCYRIVQLENLRAAVAQRRRGDRFPVAISFDDDLASHLELAAPLLERHGAPATFFLTGSSLAQPHAFWFQRLQRAVDSGRESLVEGESIHDVAARIEAMTPEARADIEVRLTADAADEIVEPGLRREDVRALVERGFTVGFHTLRHERLTTLDDASLRRALSEGRRELEEAAGHALTAISYPHGKADARVAFAAKAAGFDLGVTGAYESVVPTTDPLLVGRIEPTFASTTHFASQLARLLLRGTHA